MFLLLSMLFASNMAFSRVKLHSIFSQKARVSLLSAKYPYEPPGWANSLKNLPKHGRLDLANLPTPLHPIIPSSSSSILGRIQDLGISLFIKRDDMSGGVELGGNKIRKLDFLLADALERGYDSVVTIGGEQSNHCRATAVASRMVGLEPHVILRTKRANEIHHNDEEMGYTGNLLIQRMIGTHIYTCTPGEYGRVGSIALVSGLCKHISTTKSRKVYPIPVGGSNGLGSWGYIDGVNEALEQWKSISSTSSLKNNKTIDHVVFACGSGGTAAGIMLGMSLGHNVFSDECQHVPEMHAVGVCDNEEYFYKTVTSIAREMGLTMPQDEEGESIDVIEKFVRTHLTVHQGKGLGYANSSTQELEFIHRFALETGIVLDPVYTGKALYHFVTTELERHPKKYENSNIVFWHTGGALGMYDKGDMLSSIWSNQSPVKRLDVYSKNSAGVIGTNFP